MIIYNILLFLFVTFFYIIIIYNSKNEDRITYNSNSLCSSFLNDSIYYRDKYICNIPCNINNKFPIIKDQNETVCNKSYNVVYIYNSTIKAKGSAIIKQHKVINMEYFIFYKKLKVNIYIYI